RFGGQVLKSTGDGLLMSFLSAVQAVRCSQEIQQQLAHFAEGLAPREYLQHRIGIHLGDVLFSHADVLGNGVNIAARLQTKSTPGGICMSQTVYDVVKARLQFHANFLGPLKLKNIKEPVPAFQIPPIGQSATMVVSQPPQETSVQNETSLANIAQELQQNANQHRIKKLIFGTCQGVWENDPVVLSQFDLLSLLDKLCNRYASLPTLEKAFQDMASQLNRKAEYLAVADIVIETLQPIYLQKADAGETVQTVITDEQAIYQEVAQGLTEQQEQVRIKKLLYAVIHTAWENDSNILMAQAMESLVADVHQMAPTESDLSYHLERIIKRLNRQSRYTQVALLIAEAFQKLYQAHSIASQPNVEEATALEALAGEQTVMVVKELSTSDDGLTLVTQLGSDEPPSHESTTARLPSSAQGDVAQPPLKNRDRRNLFGLRLEIMRYTNPLRAKILLLSTVRSPFAFTQQDWITLKAKTLDDLIQDAFAYCSTYADLESKLTIMCHCVDNVAENLQTAGAILQAMKPFYPSTTVSQ
ncbi:MAG: adenylate/guanylate cyclase domain-containing protein, partial [Leptolyngbya sp. SIO1D8]|nr:adenylate/guanylate cyclase domain-containing protein [Leptolyngbya sp. SIO1D8]